MQANLPINTDAELIQQSISGDEAAYGQMVQRYQSLVCSVAYNRCGDLAMSEDLAQEAFIQAWKKLADLNDANKFKSWICTIVRNLASRSREKSDRNVATDAAQLDSVAEPASAANDPSARAISAEQEQLAWKALAEIPENYREPMILFYREEQSVARVASALEISPDAVKQRLSRGRKFLHEQLVATVETTLENSKPSHAFKSAVLVGLSSIKAKTATAGVATSVAAKSAAASTGLGGTFLLTISHLPIIAWLLRTGLAECRSEREREIMVRHIVVWTLGLIPMAAIMFATISWQLTIEPPALRSLIRPGIMALYMIPMILSSRRMEKRIEQLRIEENTATPLRAMVAGQEHGEGIKRLFVGSGLLVGVWPAIMPIVAADWIGVGLLLVSAVAISFIGACFCGTQPKKSFRVFVCSLAAISLIAIAIMLFRRAGWKASFSNYSLWFVGTMQAMVMTQTILSVVMWKRVFGKSN